jgi:hypothetical protein
MDPVSNVGHLVEVLRKQLAESQKNTGASLKSNQTAGAGPAAGRPSVEELQKKIRERLSRIDVNDPKSRQKSVHVFLESVLLWEFGERLMDDPKFYALLDDVQFSMEADPAMRESLTTLISRLR